MASLTGGFWPSALVAGLFGLHPLHVESVAWISERKDVLSTFFGLLTLWAYARFASLRSQNSHFKAKTWYAMALIFFALGLMSKPMLVTWPFVLLLLDVWPLERIPNFKLPIKKGKSDKISAEKSGSDLSFTPKRLFPLILEKIPFFALTAASCVVTFIAQKNEGAVRSVVEFPIGFRIANTLVSYCRYLAKTFWPTDLAVFYPWPDSWPAIYVLGATILLGGITFLAVRLAKGHSYFLIGWLFFLGTLVPVIGLVQVGEQAMADRYSYIPLIGVFIALSWGMASCVRRFPALRVMVVVMACMAILSCAFLARAQVSLWKDSETLFAHAARVTKDNYLALNHWSTELVLQDRLDEAEGYLREAVRLRPDFLDAHLSLGNVYALRGQLEEARFHFLRAMEIFPDSDVAHHNLGNVYKASGEIEKAIKAYFRALEIKPDYASAHANLALLLAGQGSMAQAAEHYSQVVRLQPKDAGAHYNYSTALLNLVKLSEV